MIITTTRIIECTDRNWHNITERELINALIQYGYQKHMAHAEGKRFEVHSKWAIPANIKTVLHKNEINFVEDNPDKNDYDF